LHLRYAQGGLPVVKAEEVEALRRRYLVQATVNVT